MQVDGETKGAVFLGRLIRFSVLVDDGKSGDTGRRRHGSFPRYSYPVGNIHMP